MYLVYISLQIHTQPFSSVTNNLKFTMAKLGLVVAAVGMIAVGLATAYPVAEDAAAAVDDERELQQYQFRQGGLGAIFGSIGTALVPIVGAILEPILTNLASGITEAFNNGINRTSTTPSKVDSQFLDAHGLVVRIPPDSPLYLLAHPPPANKDAGLPAVGPTGPLIHKPLQFGGKFGTGYRPELADDRDSVAVDAPADRSHHKEDVQRHDASTSVVKRHQHRVRTETEFA